MSRIDVKRPKPTAFVDVAVGRMAPLQEPPKERPESVPKLPSYGGAKAYPPSTTGSPQSSFPPSAWSLRSGTVLTDRVRTLAANLKGLPGSFIRLTRNRVRFRRG